MYTDRIFTDTMSGWFYISNIKEKYLLFLYIIIIYFCTHTQSLLLFNFNFPRQSYHFYSFSPMSSKANSPCTTLKNILNNQNKHNSLLLLFSWNIYI